jgi:hypothetical protein
LGFVPLDEVLRLLTRARQQGSVDVTGNGIHGRVFVGRGGVDLATTYDNDDLHRQLVNSGYADEKALNRITTGETTLAAIAESNTDLIELLREMTVESLYQITTRGSDFHVREGATTPYASPKSFELEALLHDTDERRREWAKVSEIVPDLTGNIRFCRDLGEREEVTIKSDDWKVLSELGAGSSVAEIADHLGTTEFWTARVTARLVNNELVILGAKPQAEPEVVEETYPVGAVVDTEPVDEYADYEAEKTAEAFDTEIEPVAESSEEDDHHDESWWREPERESEAENEDDYRTSEVESEIPSADSDDASDVEEDTEAFLEKVFSELDNPEPEVEEGHGLLRRRRMGTLRDFSSDS